MINASSPLPRVSVSGQSAGASMAIQHLVAFSEHVDGAALAGGSPYGCGGLRWSNLVRNRQLLPLPWRVAPLSLSLSLTHTHMHIHEAEPPCLARATQVCMYGGANVHKSIKYLRDRFQQGLIDDPKNLKRTPVVLFNGKRDDVVWKSEMKETREQLKEFIDSDKLIVNFDTEAGEGSVESSERASTQPTRSTHSPPLPHPTPPHTPHDPHHPPPAVHPLPPSAHHPAPTTLRPPPTAPLASQAMCGVWTTGSVAAGGARKPIMRSIAAMSTTATSI